MNTLDSRDLQHELDQLEAEADETSLNLDEEDSARLTALRDLAEEVGGDWHYGVQLIPETDFEDYARELAGETGALDNGPDHWPFTCIDWERAAHELSADYSYVEFDGVTYLYRA